jgi:hypothetical protein
MEVRCETSIAMTATTDSTSAFKPLLMKVSQPIE